MVITTTSVVTGQSNDFAFPPSPDSFHTVLFQLTRSDIPDTSYLFGTHHAFGESFFNELKVAKEKLLKSSVLILESVNRDGYEVTDLINSRNEKTNWSSYLSKSDRAVVEEIFINSPTDFEKLTPTELHVFLSRYIKMKQCPVGRSSEAHQSLDDYIGQMALENGLEVVPLESSEEQLEIIRKDVEGMPRKIHKKRLSRLIERMKSNESDCSETEWYAGMDMDYQLAKPCHNTLMLTDRNINWLQKMEALLQSKGCFIAVGLSHLMFDCGLINLLSDQGFTVVPLPAK